MAKSLKKIKYEIKELEMHSDERGWFLEMFKRNELDKDIRQVSTASLKPGVVKGNYYHLNKKEWFLVIGGKAEFYLVDSETKEKIRFKLNPEKPRVVTIFPKIAHAVKNISKKTIYFVEADSKIYNHKNPDANPYLVCK